MGAYKETTVPEGAGTGSGETFSLSIYPGNPDLSTPLIEVVNPPEIRERLMLLREWIDRRVELAKSLPCTEQTLADVKAVRADLNRISADLESQRKAAKAAVMAPWNALEGLFKQCVTNALAEADRDLKAKIETTTAEIKRPCEEGLRAYFDELCAVNHVDFITFEQTGVVVDMASARQKTPKKLREKVRAFVEEVARCVESAAGMEDADEILAEYRVTLDFPAAVQTVTDRRRRVEAVRAANETEKAAREREREAVRRVEALAPPAAVEAEPVYTVAFEVSETKSVLSGLVAYMRAHNISFRQQK